MILRITIVTFLCCCVARAADVTLTAGMKITRDTTVKPGTYRLPDKSGDGVIRIEGDNITVDFQGAALVGSERDQDPDQFTGKGIVLTGKGITLRNAKVSGFKAGIYATKCPGLLVEDIDVSGNWQMRLKSTPEAEDGSDWLWPHNNVNNEWMNNYGCGLCVEDSANVTVRRVKARHGQNGIILDAVKDSKIYDNDCSFMSGWGLAMWKCTDNVISRNAFDFCVRGYSHGVYNRGQDSAGILFFEQNNNNVLAENSATHGGDGIFGFGGREALGEVPSQEPGFTSKRKGCNDNLLINNDFSYAPAHGIEMTFSFGNRMIGNRLVYNAICGVWGGYSQETTIAGNLIEGNGEMAYGLERGGINIEHSVANVIEHNQFKGNKCGVHLWWDNDEGLMKSPWGQANSTACKDNQIRYNTFTGDDIGVQLRDAENTVMISNRMVDVKQEIVADEKSKVDQTFKPIPRWEAPKDYPVYGDTRPVGARKELRGRQYIVMTEWGPYDFSSYELFPKKVLGAEKATLQVLGPKGSFKVTRVTGEVEVSPKEGDLPGHLTVTPKKSGMTPFSVEVEAGGKKLSTSGTLMSAEWKVKFIQWEPSEDPRENPDAWKRLIEGKPIDERTLSAIDFKWGGGGLGPNLPRDRFGTLATTTVEVPAGTYRLWTISDDGIRVWIDGKLVLDDWTWHGPKENTVEVELTAGKHDIRVEHFEIDGVAQLQVRLEPKTP